MVVQRYDYLVGSDTDVGTWEEYRYDALGRRILTRARRDFLNTPDSSRALCNDPVGGSCGSYIQRSLWDGDQLLYEWRTAEGTPTGMTQGSAGYVHLEGIDQPIGLIRPEGTRVLNYTWRGLGESSVFTNGNSGDCSMFFTGCTPVQWPGKTQAGVYFTPNLLASGPSGPYTWFGTLAENGGGSTGMLFRRNRYFDPVSGRFTQQDPIGVAGGMNLYGFADGDPVNFSDAFGLMRCPPDCPSFTEADSRAVFARLAATPVEEAILESAKLTLTAAATGVAAGEALALGGRIAGALSKASTTVGNESMMMSSAFEAKVAGRLWTLSKGERFIYGARGSAEAVGRISGDATRVARWAQLKTTGPHPGLEAVNLVRKAGKVELGNLHLVIPK